MSILFQNAFTNSVFFSNMGLTHSPAPIEQSLKKTAYYVEWNIPYQVSLRSYSMVPSQAILGVTERLTKVIDLNPS